MAKTMQNVVERALVRLQVTQAGEPNDADNVAVGLTALNAFFFGLTADGLALTDAAGTAITYTEKALGDTFPIAERHFEGVAACLAVRIADDFETSRAIPIIVRDATEGMQRLEADFFAALESTVDKTLRRLPANDYFWGGTA
ncbi:MAG: hypothetical protein AAFQ67_03200 [Pseudomonadota bacterium]